MTNNQPAFPTDIGFSQDGAVQFDSSPGMTLRDYFAGQALSGMMSNQIQPKINGEHVGDPDSYAEIAYAYADAMLEARNVL